MSEEKNKNVKKKYTLLILIISLLIGLGLGIGGSYYYFNVMNKTNGGSTKNDTKTDQSEESKWTDISLDNKMFISMYNKLDEYTYLNDYTNGIDSFTDDQLAKIAIPDLQSTDFVQTSESYYTNCYYYTLNGTAISKIIENYFGKTKQLDGSKLVNTTYVMPNVNYNGNGMSIKSYDAASNTYKVLFGGTGQEGGPGPTITKRKITSAKEKDGEIEVVSKAIYIAEENSGFIYDVYSNPGKTNLLEVKKYTIDDVNDGTISVDDYLDKAATITQIYKKSTTTNDYYFASSIIK